MIGARGDLGRIHCHEKHAEWGLSRRIAEKFWPHSQPCKCYISVRGEKVAVAVFAPRMIEVFPGKPDEFGRMTCTLSNFSIR